MIKCYFGGVAYARVRYSSTRFSVASMTSMLTILIFDAIFKDSPAHAGVQSIREANRHHKASKIPQEMFLIRFDSPYLRSTVSSVMDVAMPAAIAAGMVTCMGKPGVA